MIEFTRKNIFQSINVYLNLRDRDFNIFKNIRKGRTDLQEVAKRIPECPVGKICQPFIPVKLSRNISRFVLRSLKAAVRSSSVDRDISSAGNVDLKFRL